MHLLLATLIAMASAQPQSRRTISRDSAAVVAIQELKALHVYRDSMGFGATPKALTVKEYNKVTRFQEKSLTDRASRWIGARRFWRVSASYGGMDNIYYVYVDAYSGEVLCTIHFDRPMSDELERRYDQLLKGRAR